MYKYIMLSIQIYLVALNIFAHDRVYSGGVGIEFVGEMTVTAFRV